KLKTFTESPSNISHYNVLKDEAGAVYKFRILSTPTPFSAVVTLQGVTDRNQAEALRGIRLYVTREELPDLAEEEFYYTDLMGMAVIDLQGDSVGEVQAVHNHGAGDFLDIHLNSGDVYSIPFRKESVPTVDVAARSITIDKSFLLDSKV
ncbi:ribosome maturation factor RimM, partial [Candidatus Paracaedibacter symbiosus]|uniref:ribosome maturation factor RimM n=1 Tax=Candidatus Paracaedibacter symbiosus TaxID=244582 RepID=UPI0005094059